LFSSISKMFFFFKKKMRVAPSIFISLGYVVVWKIMQHEAIAPLPS
jgi:hypothetical protein